MVAYGFNGTDLLRNATGRDLIHEKIAVRLRTHKGEWPLDTRVGFPWVELLASRPFPAGELEELVLADISQMPEIEVVRSVVVTQSGMSISIAIEVELSEEGEALLDDGEDRFQLFRVSLDAALSGSIA